MTRKAAAYAFATLLAVGAACTASAAEPLKLRINWAVTPAHLTPLIPLVPKSVYHHYGRTYTVETIRMHGTGPALTALASGNLDVGAISYQGLALSVINAKIATKAICDVLEDHPPNASSGFWVRKDLGIARVEDLKGKNVGINARGSGVDAAARAMMFTHGLKADQDYNLVEVRFPAQLPALESGRLDAAFLVTPFNFKAEKAGDYKMLFDTRQAMGGPVVTELWVVKDEFIKKHRSVLIDLIEDQILARRWMREHTAETAQLLEKVTKIPAKRFADWVMTDRGIYHSPDLMFDVDQMQKNIDKLAELKLLPRSIDAKKHVDLSMAREANDRLATN